MSIIKKDVIVAGMKKEEKLNALIDTGSSANYIKKSIADRISAIPPPKKIKTKTVVGNGSIIEGETAGIFVKVDDCSTMIPVIVHDDNKMTEDIILGVGFMQSLHAEIDMKEDTFEIKRCIPFQMI